jgi:hypothetical protein
LTARKKLLSDEEILGGGDTGRNDITDNTESVGFDLRKKRRISIIILQNF